MKRFYIFAILITICGMTAMAQNRPTGTHTSSGGDRDGVVYFTEVLQLYFNAEGMIEVMGCENDYYHVTIDRESSLVWSGIIGRERGNVIEYDSYALNATYVITLTNSRGSTTVWRLENGALIGSIMPNRGGKADQTRNDSFTLSNR